jgi:hypothetical protein
LKYHPFQFLNYFLFGKLAVNLEKHLVGLLAGLPETMSYLIDTAGNPLRAKNKASKQNSP